MKIAPARKIAFDVLLRVEREQAFASDLLHEALAAGVSRADAALATELTMGVLRWQRALDSHIAAYSKTPPSKLDIEVLLALRLGAYQLHRLERIPAHAAINDSVEFVKLARKTSAAGLVNAALRRMADMLAKVEATGAGVILYPFSKSMPPRASRADFLATSHSHPTWLAERWISRWGEDRATELMVASNEPPRVICAIHDAAHHDAIVAELQAAGLQVEEGRWLRDALTVSGGSVTSTAAFRSGRVSIQDEASQMVARLVDVQPGDRVLDVCAAPGGKTLTLARAAGAQGRVVAGDFHWHRLRGMQQRLRAAGAQGVEIVTMNAAAPLPFAADAKFNRILVDAPCTGTGTLARNPEIRWRLRADDVATLHARQCDILRNALDALAPSGRLVYSTCSLEPEENEQVIAAVLGGSARAGLRLVSGSESLAAHLVETTRVGELFDADGYFRTFPPAHGTDGFFAAIIENTQ